MKPILFNTEMVRAILDDRKTVTRRAVKQSHLRVLDSQYHNEHPEVPDKVLLEKLCEPPYRPGDILYVRETWVKLNYVDPDGYTHFDQPMYYYAADGDPDITLCNENGFELDDQRIRWRPSIHMPKEVARIFLRVTDVRVERLQDMTNADALKEGCDGRGFGPSSGVDGTLCTAAYDFSIERFMSLWDSTIKPKDREKYGWSVNPWVWVIEFERVSEPEKEDRNE